MKSASDTARNAWKLAEAGSLHAAIAEYEKALEVADDRTDDLWYIHGSFGAVLEQARELDRAIQHHRAAAAVAIRQGEEPDSHAVQVERYFAAAILLETGRAAEALAELADLVSLPRVEGYVLSVQAQALRAVGDSERARDTAGQVLERAQSADQRERIREQLREVLAGG